MTELEELRELSEHATPGKWLVGRYIFDGTAAMIFAPEGVVAATERKTHPLVEWDTVRTYHNSEFIAECVNYVRSQLEKK